jgi:hypothetical protein
MDWLTVISVGVLVAAAMAAISVGVDVAVVVAVETTIGVFVAVAITGVDEFPGSASVAVFETVLVKVIVSVGAVV